MGKEVEFDNVIAKYDFSIVPPIGYDLSGRDNNRRYDHKSKNITLFVWGMLEEGGTPTLTITDHDKEKEVLSEFNCPSPGILDDVLGGLASLNETYDEDIEVEDLDWDYTQDPFCTKAVGVGYNYEVIHSPKGTITHLLLINGLDKVNEETFKSKKEAMAYANEHNKKCVREWVRSK